MSETKTYPIGVALSVASGKLLCEFSQLHEAITDLAGWPVMTHHMASRELMDGVARKVISQVPWMPGAVENMPDWSGLARDDVRSAIELWLDRIEDAHGHVVEIVLGEPLPAMGVLDGLERLGGAR
ncbi:hypothetical protein [Blastococcus xanthinilyticus]|uniref:DUF7736 domain-containing protein n=1 Tax=Blastococcus xanthinilyticus TaxID=1564164 RepID=A0A5S5CLI1_9ACTN|nr:hypothetical protein [Blastococcus xanthinilyticus]TYP82047.1 hypothetical protein BD833_12031 [Blastococcus xanthinilyticus]